MKAVILDNVPGPMKEDLGKRSKNLSLEVKKGERVLIMGPSEAGKTTIARMISGLIPHFYKGSLKGEIIINESIYVRHSKLEALVGKVGIVFNDPSSQLFNSTVLEEVAFGVANMVSNRTKLFERINSLLKTLSGGQKQLVALATVLAMAPEIFVFNEPTSNLDLLSTRIVIDALNKLLEKHKYTAIIIEHKIEKFLLMVNRVVVIKEGNVYLTAHQESYLECMRSVWI